MAVCKRCGGRGVVITPRTLHESEGEIPCPERCWVKQKCPHYMGNCKGVLVKVTKVYQKNLVCGYFYVKHYSCGHKAYTAGGDDEEVQRR